MRLFGAILLSLHSTHILCNGTSYLTRAHADNRTLDTFRFSCVNILWRPYSTCVSCERPFLIVFGLNVLSTHRMDWTMNVNYIVDAIDVGKMRSVRNWVIEYWLIVARPTRYLISSRTSKSRNEKRNHLRMDEMNKSTISLSTYAMHVVNRWINAVMCMYSMKAKWK